MVTRRNSMPKRSNSYLHNRSQLGQGADKKKHTRHMNRVHTQHDLEEKYSEHDNEEKSSNLRFSPYDNSKKNSSQHPPRSTQSRIRPSPNYTKISNLQIIRRYNRCRDGKEQKEVECCVLKVTTASIQKCIVHNKADKILELMENLQTKAIPRINASLILYNAAINGLIKTGKIDDALRLFQQMELSQMRLHVIL